MASNMNTRSRKRRESYSPIESLPVEMLLEIFEYLDSWSIRRCSEVCLTFFHLTLRPEFRKFFKLTISEDYLAANCGIGKLFAPERRTIRTFDHLTLEKVNFKTLPFAKNFFMRLGREITEIELQNTFFLPLMIEKGSDTQDTFFRKNILNNFPNLEKLVLENLDIDDLNYYPPSLKEIHINSSAFFEDLKEHEEFLIHKNGLVNLKKLIFTQVYPFDNEDFPVNVTDAVKTNLNDLEEHLYYIKNNFNILEDTVFDLNHITGLVFEEISSISFVQLHHFSNLKLLEIEFEEEVNCFTDHEKAFPDFSHVKELKLHIDSFSICDTCITNILSSFTGLTELDLKANLTDAQYRLIYANMPKLEYLELHGVIPRHIFDSAEHSPNSIEKLKNLQHLLVYDTSMKKLSGLSNKCFLKFAYLPHLKTLRLSESYNENIIQITGIRHLIRQCPQISSFSIPDSLDDKEIKEIIRGWPHLTTLFLPHGDICYPKTWNLIKDTCRFLKYLSVDHHRLLDFKFVEQCSLFKNISSLKWFKKGDRVIFTRTDYHEKDVYLKEHGELHRDVSIKRRNSAIESISKKKRCLSYNGYSFSTISEIENDDSVDEYYPDEVYKNMNSELSSEESGCECVWGYCVHEYGYY
ncbi:uncharacterized protein LOC134831780 [Culicoides brevitarsis]|uniref:uncharacterized protein LOC134831780 n=1 Tax=Culicoides brevitarsis TaxID=469753 RepID=UPI00307B82A6